MATITIRIFVPNIEDVILNFDSLQVRRSKLGTPYTDALFITATEPEPPELVGTEEGEFSDLNGKDLTIEVNGDDGQFLSFVSANPLTLADVIEEINDGFTGITASDDGTGKLKLTGDTEGTAGTIEVTDGTAVSVLGLSQTIVHGKNQHVDLLDGVDEYLCFDFSGDPTYWYSSRFYDSETGTVGSWSDWLEGSTGYAVSESELIVGKIQMADIDGSALSGMKVTLVNVYSPLISDGYFLAGRSKQIETNSLGLAETTLIKGMLLDVVVEGTSIIRRITVPSTGTEFDLMDPDLVQDDPFQIQVPDLPSAVRRS